MKLFRVQDRVTQCTYNYYWVTQCTYNYYWVTQCTYKRIDVAHGHK